MNRIFAQHCIPLQSKRKLGTLATVVREASEFDNEKRIPTVEVGADLSHLSSPEDDAKLRDKIDASVDSLLTHVPLPSNPMTYALKKNPSEMKAKHVNSILKDAVRAKYHAMKRKQSVEEGETCFPRIRHP